MQLADKVALVTGGGGGIGRAICLGLAREGAKVAVCDIDLSTANETASLIGPPAFAVQADVSSSEDVDRMVEETVRKFGRLDILVNGAALIPFSPALEMAVEEWDRVMAVNLRGVFLCCRAAARVMKAQGGGRIVNISSGRGVAGSAAAAHYAASKGGVNALTVSLGIAWADYGINVNAVCPGVTATPRATNLLGPEEVKARQIAPANKRIGQPEDAVGPVIFLCTEASKTMVGQILFVKTP